ncbi:MFS transporter, partial [Pseudomonas aeruginosa]
LVWAGGPGGWGVLRGTHRFGPAARLVVVLPRLFHGVAGGGAAGPATTYIRVAAPPHKRGTSACWLVVAHGIGAVAAGL